MSSSLGQKIRFFRKRSGLSQLELETLIGTSSGSLSRIEKEEVNPQKETIEKIAKVLKLNLNEVMYLNGSFDIPVSQVEIESARNEVKAILNSKNTIAYLLDEKHRIWGISKALQSVLKLTDSDLINLLGTNLFEVIVDPEVPGHKLLVSDNYAEMVRFQLARLLYEMPYILSDDYWINLFEKLNKFDEFENALEDVLKRKYDIYTPESRIIKFYIYGINIEMSFAEEPLKENPRFAVVVYSPNNRFLSLLAKTV